MDTEKDYALFNNWGNRLKKFFAYNIYGIILLSILYLFTSITKLTLLMILVVLELIIIQMSFIGDVDNLTPKKAISNLKWKMFDQKG
jgi:hypothetical protein